jgi:hypothetical protein
MSRLIPSLLLPAVLVLGLLSGPAQAQLARTFVSAARGNDASDCNRLTPCRTFQRAHDNTLANGEITVLDPGGYGSVTITKALSITNDGVGEAGALVSGGFTGISVAAGADDAVSLRGLTVKGIGFGGGNGIAFNSGKSLTVENCVIRNLSGNSFSFGLGFGLSFRPNASSALVVSNTLVADNTASGLVVEPSAAASVRAVFNGVELYGNGGSGLVLNGGFTTGSVQGTAVGSVAAGNRGNGFAAQSEGGATKLMVMRSVAANNGGAGLLAFSNATARIGLSTLTGNATSWQANGGATVRSYGNNRIDGNGDANPAPPATALK